MAAVALTFGAAGAAKAPPEDRVSFAVTFVATFVLLLGVALVAQALMLPWRTWLPGAEGPQSLIDGVKSAAYGVMSLT